MKEWVERDSRSAISKYYNTIMLQNVIDNLVSIWKRLSIGYL